MEEPSCKEARMRSKGRSTDSSKLSREALQLMSINFMFPSERKAVVQRTTVKAKGLDDSLEPAVDGQRGLSAQAASVVEVTAAPQHQDDQAVGPAKEDTLLKARSDVTACGLKQKQKRKRKRNQETRPERRLDEAGNGAAVTLAATAGPATCMDVKDRDDGAQLDGCQSKRVNTGKDRHASDDRALGAPICSSKAAEPDTTGLPTINTSKMMKNLTNQVHAHAAAPSKLGAPGATAKKKEKIKRRACGPVERIAVIGEVSGQAGNEALASSLCPMEPMKQHQADAYTAAATVALGRLGGAGTSTQPVLDRFGGAGTSTQPVLDRVGGAGTSTQPAPVRFGGAGMSTQPAPGQHGGAGTSKQPTLGQLGAGTSMQPAPGQLGGAGTSTQPAPDQLGGAGASMRPTADRLGGASTSMQPAPGWLGGAGTSTQPAPGRHGGTNTSTQPAPGQLGGTGVSTQPTLVQLGGAVTSMQPTPGPAAGLVATGAPDYTQQPSSNSARRAAQQAERGQQLTPTNSTPFKGFVPIAMPHLDLIGKHDCTRFAELQRQLSEVRALYQELKETKIQDLESVLAEQVDYAEEQVRIAQQTTQQWKAAAERAEAEVKATQSQETADLLAALELRNEHLKLQTSDLLLRVALLERTLSLTQQELHDARAELVLLKDRAPHAPNHDGNTKSISMNEDDEHSFFRELSDKPESNDVGADGAYRSLAKATQQEPVPNTMPGVSDASAAAAACDRDTNSCPGVSRGVGLQFPLASPDIGAQFLFPVTQLFSTQGMNQESPSTGVGCGVSVECQRIVKMLPTLRTPSTSLESLLHFGSHPRSSRPGATPEPCGLSGSKHGISSECQRVVRMLPSSSIQSHFQSGPGLDPATAPGAVPATSNNRNVLLQAGPAQGQTEAQPSNGQRRSTGSPIDGICGSANRKAAGAGQTTDLSCSPLQQERYSFVDLDPASARKAACTEMAAVENGQPTSVPEANATGPKSDAAIMVQGGLDAPGADALPTAITKALRPAPVREAGATQQAGAVNPAVCGGSVGSKQGSCNIPGQVNIARQLQQEAQHRMGAAGRNPQASGGQSPVSMHKSPTASPSPAVTAMADNGPANQSPGAGPLAHDHQEQAGSTFPRSPSPRTAKLVFYENLYGWHVDVISTKPLEVFRLNHMKSGFTLEIRETTALNDEDVPDDATSKKGTGCQRAQNKWYEYDPIDFGTAGDLLPKYLKEAFFVSASERLNLLELLTDAINDKQGQP